MFKIATAQAYLVTVWIKNLVDAHKSLKDYVISRLASSIKAQSLSSPFKMHSQKWPVIPRLNSSVSVGKSYAAPQRKIS